MAAPFCSLMAARYPKYSHCTASLAFLAGPEMSKPYIPAITFMSSRAWIWSWSSSAARMEGELITQSPRAILSAFFCSMSRSMP